MGADPIRGLDVGYDVANGAAAAARLTELQREHGFDHVAASRYPSTADPFAIEGIRWVASDVDENDIRLIGLCGEDAADRPLAVVDVSLGYGTLRLNVGSTSPEEAQEWLEFARERIPPDTDADPERVKVAFWAYGQHGPQQMNRELDAPSWEQIAGNYAEATRANLGWLMEPDFAPGRGGQLLLWHGEPGTGKTTALRALAQQWRRWAKLHYITDPEKFFGDHADYMLQVMLGEDYHEPDEGDGDSREPWRVLLLEDAGELLQRDAKKETGQALSRFLNAVDGLIGQGLRVLTLVTTNEEQTAWHPAVARHGRALAEVEFPRLSAEESQAWLERRELDASRVTRGCVLSDLYAIAEDRERQDERPLVGFGA